MSWGRRIAHNGNEAEFRTRQVRKWKTLEVRGTAVLLGKAGALLEDRQRSIG